MENNMIKDVENETVTAPQVETPAPELSKEEKEAMDALQYLMTAIPAARYQTNKLTGVQAKRVLSALLETPLENETASFTTRDAMQLFNLGCEIQARKHVLFKNAGGLMTKIELDAAMEQAEKDKLEANNNVINEGKSE